MGAQTDLKSFKLAMEAALDESFSPNTLYPGGRRDRVDRNGTDRSRVNDRVDPVISVMRRHAIAEGVKERDVNAS